MAEQLRVLSLFSGVGGFDLGLERAGMRTVMQCEIDANCQQVLRYHWRDIPQWDDVTTLTGRHVLDMTGGVDVVAWGSPCQDLSVAGKRAGLEGQRSGLFYEGIRIIREMREISNGQYPIWSIWENVAGALSSGGGADFGQVLYEMDEVGACFSEWRVLDAQYFGVPQRRRRIFVVSRFHPAGACDSGCQIPIIAKSSGGHPEEIQQTRQGATRSTADSTRAAGESPILIDRGSLEMGENAQYAMHISDDAVTPTLVAKGPHAVAVSESSDDLNDVIVPTLRSGGDGGVPSSRGEHLILERDVLREI